MTDELAILALFAALVALTAGLHFLLAWLDGREFDDVDGSGYVRQFDAAGFKHAVHEDGTVELVGPGDDS
jgi:hypothetical protein